MMGAPDLSHVRSAAMPDESRVPTTNAAAWLSELNGGFAGSGSPNKCSSIGAPAARASPTAVTASAMPLNSIIRLTTATFTGGCGGSGASGMFAGSIPAPPTIVTSALSGSRPNSADRRGFRTDIACAGRATKSQPQFARIVRTKRDRIHDRATDARGRLAPDNRLRTCNLRGEPPDDNGPQRNAMNDIGPLGPQDREQTEQNLAQ